MGIESEADTDLGSKLEQLTISVKVDFRAHKLDKIPTLPYSAYVKSMGEENVFCASA